MRISTFLLAVAVLLCAHAAIGDVKAQDDPDQAEADPGPAPVDEARPPVEGGYVVCSGLCAPARQNDPPTTGYVAVFGKRVPSRELPAIMEDHYGSDLDWYNHSIFSHLVETEHDCRDAGYGDTNECSTLATERAALEEADRIVAESKIRSWTTSEVFDVKVMRCPHGEKDFDAAEEAVERAAMRWYGLQCIQKLGSLEYVTGANNLIECRGCFAPAIDAAIRETTNAPTTYHLRWQMADNGDAYFQAGFWPETDDATIVARGIYSPGCEVELFDD